MAATGLRAIFIAGLALLLAAGFAPAGAASSDPGAEAWDVVATMAAALSAPDDMAFMKPVSKQAPGHAKLESMVRSLAQAHDVVSSISPISNEGDEKSRKLVVDWYLEIQPQVSGALITRRREQIELQLVRTAAGKRWTVTSLSPVEFFAPPSL